ncbi:hypothetical protein EDD92_1018 [Streptomyces sp. TLI_185]|nr:hypothetical protein EDD92_1018 [Streptomyces sp. TLI_185]
MRGARQRRVGCGHRPPVGREAFLQATANVVRQPNARVPSVRWFGAEPLANSIRSGHTRHRTAWANRFDASASTGPHDWLSAESMACREANASPTRGSRLGSFGQCPPTGSPWPGLPTESLLTGVIVGPAEDPGPTPSSPRRPRGRRSRRRLPAATPQLFDGADGLRTTGISSRIDSANNTRSRRLRALDRPVTPGAPPPRRNLSAIPLQIRHVPALPHPSEPPPQPDRVAPAR